MERCNKCGAYLDPGEKCDCKEGKPNVVNHEVKARPVSQRAKKRQRPYRYGRRG